MVEADQQTPGGSASQQILSALSALPGEPVMNTSGTDKMTSMLHIRGSR